MNTSRREAKKTETIEVRVASETKTALAERARAERRTVSDVIRGLIENYLRRPLAEPQTMTGAKLMRLAAIPAALAAVALAGSILVSPARAGEVVLAVSGAIENTVPGVQIFHPNDGARGRGQIVREFATNIEATVGQSVVLCLPRDASSALRIVTEAGAPCVFDAASGYALLLRVEAVRDGQAYVTMRPINEATDLATEPATAIPIAFGQSAAMLTTPVPYRAADAAPREDVFRLTVVANRDEAAE